MSIEVCVNSKDVLKNVESAYKMIQAIEKEFGMSLISLKKFTNYINIESLLVPLVKEGFLEEEFIDFVREEYGEPWVKGYPIDSKLLIEALCTWTKLDSTTIEIYLSHMISNLSLSYTIYRDLIFEIYNSYVSTKVLKLEPIEKEYRNIKLKKNLDESSVSKDIKKETLDSVLESTEAILALTDDELIKEQILNIKERLFGKETISSEISCSNDKLKED